MIRSRLEDREGRCVFRQRGTVLLIGRAGMHLQSTCML